MHETRECDQNRNNSYKSYTLATRITVICTEKTDTITYVLLVKIVTDEPINSPNFYRWLSEQTFFLFKFFFSQSLFL